MSPIPSQPNTPPTLGIILQTVADLIPHRSHILDLGCGKGQLLHHLIKHKECSGYGIEIDDGNLQECINKKINTLQLNLEEGLAIFDDNSFDIVLQIDTLQHLRNTETMLQESARVGKRIIVAFPNFAHWSNRLSVLRGRMPVNNRLPYQWYDTPNIRVSTFKDFETLASKNNLQIIQSFGLQKNRKINNFINLFSDTAIFELVKT